MKKILTSILILSIALVSAQQNSIFTMHFLRVEGDVEAFEKVQSMYMKKVAQKATDNGDIMFWAFLRRLNLDYDSDENRINYLFVQTNKNINATLSDANNWWTNAPNVLSKEEQDMVAALQKSFTWKISHRHIFINEVQIANSVGSHIQFNFARPDNLSGFISENKTLWNNYFKSNMSKMGMVNWGVGRKLEPLSANWSTVVSWDMFDSLESLMNYRIGFSLPSNIANKSKMSEYLTEGFRNQPIFEVVTHTQQ